MLLKIYIILSLFSGAFVLPLLVLIQLKYKKSLISQYIAFFSNFYIYITITGLFIIYDDSSYIMPSFVFILFFLSLVAFNITMPLFFNSFNKIPYTKTYTKASIVITIISLSTIGRYGQRGPEAWYTANILLQLTFLYCISCSIIRYKKLQNNIEKKIGLALIIIFTSFLFTLFTQAAMSIAYLFFMIMNILSIIFLSYFLRFNNNSLNVQIDITKGFELTPREIEVFHLLNRGLSYKDIANELAISVATVKTHLNKIYKKTDTKSRFELTAKFSY